MKPLFHKLLALLRGRNKGNVALGFALSFPILLTLIGVMVQYALLMNAQLTVDHAVQAGARSAMTSLPTDAAVGDPGGQAFVERSVRMTLESLSPASPEGTSTEAQEVADAIQKLGATLPDRYTQRYTYAQNATLVTIEALGSGPDFSKNRSPRVRITVQYDFQITVPLVSMVVGRVDTVAGVTGRFRTLTSTVDVQLSPGREGK